MSRRWKRLKKWIAAAVLAAALLLNGMSVVFANESAVRGGTSFEAEMGIENETFSTMAAAASGLSVTNMSRLTKDDLVSTLLGEGVTVSNISLRSNTLSAGIFTGGIGIIGFEEGIVLSTGHIAKIVGPYQTVDPNNNTQNSKSTINSMPGDGDLARLIPGSQTYDATVLEFDFVPEHDIISFEYVFASNEYNFWVNRQFNDVFGFFVNGENAALIPGTSTPVSINTVNGGNPIGVNAQNPQYYINNTPPGSHNLNTNLNGMTVVLPVQVEVNKGVTNHIKMAIADVGDAIWDSNVFIKAGSFSDKPIDYPPAVTASTDREPNANGWYNDDVTVTFTATDDDVTPVAYVDPPVIVTAEGADQLIEGIATDTAGQEGKGSITISLDKTAPLTDAAVAPSSTNGWNTTDVTIELHATDNLSGVATTQYRISDGSWQEYTGTITVSSGGIYLLEYYSVDRAGNIEVTKGVAFKVDKTAPAFSIIANGIALTDGAVFKSSQPVTLVLTVSDNLSGVAQTSITVDGLPYIPGTALDWAGKLGAHTINIVVADQAGNVTQSQLTVNAATGFDVIRQLIERFSKSGELSGPMLVQLTNSLTQAESQYNKGHLDQSIKSMNDFLKHINNKALQSHISANAKQILINEMNTLIQYYSK